MTDLEDTGAIDWLLVEAPGKEINGEMVPPLLDLVDRRLIRILDVLVLVKRSDDDFDALTTSQLDPEQVGDLGALEGASSGLLSHDDAATAASVLAPGSIGLMPLVSRPPSSLRSVDRCSCSLSECCSWSR